MRCAHRLGDRNALAVFQVQGAVGDDLLAGVDPSGQRDDPAFDERDFDIARASVILVEDEQRAQLDGLSLVPGMPADVIIAKGDRTLFDYIAAPIENVVVKSLRQ